MADFPITASLDGTFYFASDFHLGAPDEATSRQRETLLARWFDQAMQDATAIFLLGDIFDFWFEYHDVIPKGYHQLFSKFAELKEKKIPVFYFTGNHDMWVKNYFQEEFSFTIFREQQLFVLNGKRCLIGHGDGLGKGDYGYKLIKKMFAFRPNVVLYSALPPRHAFALAKFFSRKSRAMTSADEKTDGTPAQERLFHYAAEVVKEQNIDFFIYGHRHLPLFLPVTEQTTYMNIGDWLIHNSYGKATPEQTELLFF